MQRTTVLLLFGGESSEHEVSISSARNVYAAMDNTKFDVILGYIDRVGKWWLLDQLAGEINTHGLPQLTSVLGSECFVTIPSNRVIKPDVIMPILHGKNGEDGSVQGLAQLLHVPIVGCGMTASSICMDKVATKQILQANDIRIVPYRVHHSYDPKPDFNKLSMRLGSPLFIKPANAGSSVGVSKVYSEDELTVALELAHKHDDVALIERGIAAHELEVAILGNPPHHKVSGVGEIQSGDDFYTYDAKYAASSSSKCIIPADISIETIAYIKQVALKVYELLGCRGLARIDFFMDEDGKIYVNEVNTLPGFTNISMYPKLWRAQGILYPELIESLISAALNGATIES